MLLRRSSGLGLGTAAVANTGAAAGNVVTVGGGAILIGATTANLGNGNDLTEDVIGTINIPAGFFSASQTAGASKAVISGEFHFYAPIAASNHVEGRVYVGGGPGVGTLVFDSSSLSATSVSISTITIDIQWVASGSLLVIVTNVKDQGTGLGAVTGVTVTTVSGLTFTNVIPVVWTGQVTAGSAAANLITLLAAKLMTAN